MARRPAARIVLLLAVVALALPAAAGAQQAPTLGAPEQTTSAPVVTTSTSGGNGGLATWQEVLIFGAGLILLAGIAWAIIGDARHRAPVADRHQRAGELEPTGPGGKLPAHERKRRKDRARQKARAARASRKRNR